jgi:hypothetical protein
MTLADVDIQPRRAEKKRNTPIPARKDAATQLGHHPPMFPTIPMRDLSNLKET